MINKNELLRRAIHKYILPLIAKPIDKHSLQFKTASDNSCIYAIKNRTGIQENYKTSEIIFFPNDFENSKTYFTCSYQKSNITDSFPNNISFKWGRVNSIYEKILIAVDIYFYTLKKYGKKKNLDFDLYRICDLMYEKGVCDNLFGDKSFVVQKLLNGIDYWTLKKDEGDNVFLAFIVDGENSNESSIESYSDFLIKHQASAVLTENDVAIEFEQDGYKLVYLSDVAAQEDGKRMHFVPLDLLALSRKCTGKKVGIVLNNSNDVLFIQNGDIKFAKRGGEWTSFNWESFCSQIKVVFPQIETDLVKNVFLSIIDVAFSHCGGSIVIVNENLETRITQYVAPSDLLDTDLRDCETEAKKERLEVFKSLIRNRCFSQIDDHERTEYLGIDGALIMNDRGKILSIGAILNNCSENGTGARTAAMKGLSKKEGSNCIAIKISADGYISVFSEGEERMQIK